MTARLLTAVLAACACLLAAAPSALAGAPALKLVGSSQPTNLSPGEGLDEEPTPLDAWATAPQYLLAATNVGSAPTSGPITFTETLPGGLTPLAGVARDKKHFSISGYPGISCSVSGQTVTCTDTYPVQPGEWAQVAIPMKVADDAPSGITTSQASVSGGGATEARTTIPTTISSVPASYGFVPGPSGLSIAATGTDGAPATQAGSHPDQVTVDTGFPTLQSNAAESSVYTLLSAGHPRTVKVNLPRGMVANPNAIPVRCTEAELNKDSLGVGVSCPNASVIGTATVLTDVNALVPDVAPLYNMVPPPGVAAEFAFDAIGTGIYVHLMGGVNSAGEFELGSDTREILARQLNPIYGVQVQLWGNPSDPIHDGLRGLCAPSTEDSCPLAERTNTPFLTMPSSCRSSLSANGATSDWEEPLLHSASALAEDSLGNPTGTEGCNKLEFNPTFEARPSTNLADAPSGMDVNLHVPQSEGFESLATANFKDIKVTFPPGMAVNPSSANGQEACSSAQIGLSTPVGDSHPHFNEDPANCPAASKLGSVEVKTPLLDHPVSGSLYLAKPFDNPFDSMVAVYIDVEDPLTGVISKLAGKVDLDPQTGQVSTTFADNPELPIEDVKVSLFKGPRAPLVTPQSCATHTTRADITPWSTPEGADVHTSDAFLTTLPASGSGNCPGSEAQAPNRPHFTAGTIAPQAGGYSPFVLKLSREDGTQRLAGFETTLPKGLIGKLAGIPYCSEAQIGQAMARSHPNEGAVEKQSPSCPAASEIGTVTAGAGAGILPFYASGKAYLAGPYKGAPLSIVTITPGIAGPFDLGAITVRAALYVDPETTQAKAVSDPLPRILEGIPLDIRSIAVKLDRSNFTLNPTSCDPSAVTGNVSSILGGGASLNSPFQVGGCSSLGFKPKLAFRLKGGTLRTGHPALRATLTFPKGSTANIASAQVSLPSSEFLDQAHIKTICTRVQFAADQCPPGAVYGSASAITPLLDKPLSGPVYLRSSNNKLPDLVADLNGQIHVVLVGRIDSIHGGIRTTFEAVPDAPVTKFTLEMKGAKKGLLINSRNICAKTNRATAKFGAQNGKSYEAKPALVASCKGKGHRKGKGHKAGK